MPFDFTAILNDWGINFNHLIIFTAIGIVAFVFSLREFLYWFLRLNTLAKKQKEILEKLDAIEQTLTKATDEMAPKKFVIAATDRGPSEVSHSDPRSPLAKKLH